MINNDDLIVEDKLLPRFTKVQFVDLLVKSYKLPTKNVRKFMSLEELDYELYMLDLMGDHIELEHAAVLDIFNKGIELGYLTELPTVTPTKKKK